MGRAEIREAVIGILASSAPDADARSVDPGADLTGALDLDSFDFATFIVQLDETLGVRVPDRDVLRLATLDGCVSYLARSLDTSGTP